MGAVWLTRIGWQLLIQLVVTVHHILTSQSVVVASIPSLIVVIVVRKYMGLLRRVEGVGVVVLVYQGLLLLLHLVEVVHHWISLVFHRMSLVVDLGCFVKFFCKTGPSFRLLVVLRIHFYRKIK